MIKNKYNIIGVMSGTSLDGLDICWVKFTKKNKWSYQILAGETLQYSKKMITKLKSAINCNTKDLELLDIYFTNYIGDCINDFKKKYSVISLDLICSHGHTVFHEPDKGMTFQIGNLQKLANKIQCKLVCDFRVQDVALGGQGAPLVPVGDELLFSQFDFCLNLGGFSNISFNSKGQRIAFDICPVNIIMNHYSKKMGFDYDKGGEFASKGVVDENLLNALNSLSFYKKGPPKSLGLEWVRSKVIPLINTFSLDYNSILRTLVEHIVDQITCIIEKYNLNKGLFTGGGALNTYLMKCISERLNNPIIETEKELIHFKEALIFGFLGVLKLRNEINCLASVTGANRDHSTGKIYYPS